MKTSTWMITSNVSAATPLILEISSMLNSKRNSNSLWISKSSNPLLEKPEKKRILRTLRTRKKTRKRMLKRKPSLLLLKKRVKTLRPPRKKRLRAPRKLNEQPTSEILTIYLINHYTYLPYMLSLAFIYSLALLTLLQNYLLNLYHIMHIYIHTTYLHAS